MNTHFPIFLPVLISYNDGTNSQFQVEEYKVEVKAISALVKMSMKMKFAFYFNMVVGYFCEYI